jgi:molybdate transport system substrate-binding protein
MTRPLRVISSMATRSVLAEAMSIWPRERGGHAVTLESVGGVDAVRRVRDGEAFDVIVLAADTIDSLAAAGLIVAPSKTDLLRSDVAIAVRAGAPHPDVASEGALRDAVRAAKRIGYSTGPSGIALVHLFERWNLAQAMRDRLVQAPPGIPVARLIAQGDVELGFQQRSELLNEHGVDVIGGMPPGTEIVTTFSGGVASSSSATADARGLLEFLRSPHVADLARKHGMQPA